MRQAVLVAGGAGYIGSHVCKALDKAGYLPVTVDDLSTGHAELVRWGPLVKAGVDDVAAVSATIAHHGIQAVVDLAGCSDVAESIAHPDRYFHNNVAVKSVFLQTLRDLHIRNVVFSSTAAVYGEPECDFIDETHPLAPLNPYGKSKLGYEAMLRDNHADGGPAWMALRYFNAAGASFDGDIGEWHEQESHLIPRACFASLGQMGRLEIYGNDYPTPDGTAIRDYVHVMDLADAHIRALAYLKDGGAPEICNLGTGQGTSIAQILAAFERLSHPVPHRFRPRRPGDPSRLVADAARAGALLGWHARQADIDAIIESAYRWHARGELSLKIAS